MGWSMEGVQGVVHGLVGQCFQLSQMRCHTDPGSEPDSELDSDSLFLFEMYM